MGAAKKGSSLIFGVSAFSATMNAMQDDSLAKSVKVAA